jgi:hypothetical protein
MKKNILFIATVLFVFLGNQSVSAQAKMKKEVQSTSAEKVQVLAKEKTNNLVRPLSLNKDQQNQVYTLFRNVEDKIGSSSSITDAKEQEAMQTKIDKHVSSKMKEILNEEQFQKYLKLVQKM